MLSPYIDGLTYLMEQKEASKTLPDHIRNMALMCNQTMISLTWSGLQAPDRYRYSENSTVGTVSNIKLQEMSTDASALLSKP